MFQFPAFASYINRIIPLQGIGLSHSEIRGSKVICTFPRLIAAYHVLHRLREPRHPPCALNYFFCYRNRHHCQFQAYTLSLHLIFKLYYFTLTEDSFYIAIKKIILKNCLSHYVKERLRTDSNAFETIGLTASILFSMVENNGFEPLTLCVQGRCSSQLS